MNVWIAPFRPLRSSLVVAGVCLLAAGCSSGGSMFDVADQRTGVIRPAKSEFTTTHPHDFPVHGIDVSKYQGDIDWNAVKASGTAFAYIKATEGTDHVDSKFLANWNGARAAGVPHGAYHFVYWCRTPQQEIGWFKQNVPVEADALPPVLDVEATPTSRSCKRHLQREEVISEMRQMLADMERTYHKKPIIYTTVDFYEAILQPNELDEYPIWVRSTKYSPHVRYGSRNWHFWQYQSDAQIPGIKGNVDRNAFRGDINQWRAFAGGNFDLAPSRAPVAAPVVQPVTAQAFAPPSPVSAPTLKPVTATAPASIEQVINDPDAE